MGNDVLVGTVFHTESFGDDPEPGKAQFFIKGKGRGIGTYDGVKLHDAEAQLFRRGKTVPDKGLSYVAAPDVPFYGVARIAYMPAASYIIGMENIKSHNFVRTCLAGNAGEGLLLKESHAGALIKKFRLGESHPVFHHLIPDQNGVSDILFIEFPYKNFHGFRSSY